MCRVIIKINAGGFFVHETTVLLGAKVYYGGGGVEWKRQQKFSFT